MEWVTRAPSFPRPARDCPGGARFCLASAALALLVACGGRPDDSRPAPASSTDDADVQVVNFANFADEVGPHTIADFERETGLRVNYQLYDTNAELEARLLVGRSGLDLVVPGNNFLQRGIAAGIYRPLDRARLTNWKNLDPAILAKLAHNDPGNRYAVPYLWGTTSLGYNVDEVEAALGRPAPDSWSLLFDPANAARLQHCGIAVIDSGWIMVSAALLYLGRDPNSEREQDLADAMKVLMAIRPYVRNITTIPTGPSLAEGEYCLVVAPNADIRTAREVARAAGRSINLRYLIPREGALMWIDTLAIPVDAPHPEQALRLIDYLLRPGVIADVTNTIHFANANAAATGFVDPDTRRDPTVYPDAADLARLHMNAALSDAYTRLVNREFTRFRTGH